MKKCSSCKMEKSAEQFSKCSSASDGLQGYCKQCQSEKSKFYEARRDKNLKRERMREWGKKRRANPEHIEYQKQYREANKERAKVRAKIYYENNKDKVTAHRNNDRAKLKGIGGRVTSSEWIKILEFSDYKCLACEGNSSKNPILTMDHIVPFELKGTHCPMNVQPLCLFCNLKKGINELDFRTREFIEQVEKMCQQQ